jgi:hypothetical protein
VTFFHNIRNNLPSDTASHPKTRVLTQEPSSGQNVNFTASTKNMKYRCRSINAKGSPTQNKKIKVQVPVFLTLALQEMSGQTHNQALYTLRKNLNNHWAGSRAGKHMWEKIKIFLHLSGI